MCFNYVNFILYVQKLKIPNYVFKFEKINFTIS